MLSWVMVLLGIGSGVVVAVDISRRAPQPNIENRIKVSVLQALDERDCRLLPLDTQQELSQHIRLTLGIDEYSLGVVQHQPLRRISSANRWMNGRKPTPCTAPRMMTRIR